MLSFRAFSVVRFSRRSSTGPARRTSSAASCGSTGTAASIADSRNASQPE